MGVRLPTNPTVYIIAPSNFATGGPELLHQFAWKLRDRGVKVFMAYTPRMEGSPVHPNYEAYGIEWTFEIPDEESSYVVAPETQSDELFKFKKAKTILWWLSVDNYFLNMKGIFGRINRAILIRLDSQRYLFFNKKLKDISFHFVQSRYARVFLSNHGISDTVSLSDYLHSSFLKERFDQSQKENIVVYNPKKGALFTSRLIEACPEYRFVPVINMQREEVVQLLKSAKVYVDFGNHPGKDRIPREAAFLGCCVITNRKGSAKYESDLPIPRDYKFSSSSNEFSSIRNLIKKCFDNYESEYGNFDSYREEINRQEEVFNEEVESIISQLGLNKV